MPLKVNVMEKLFLREIQLINLLLMAVTQLEVSGCLQAHALTFAIFVAETALAHVIREHTGTTGVICTETGRNKSFGHIGSL